MHGDDGSLEVHGSAWASPPTAQIIGYRNGDDKTQVLEIPDSIYGDADKGDAFGVFKHNSVGTRLFIDSILNDRPIEPSFEQGYRVQRVIEAAMQSHQENRKISL